MPTTNIAAITNLKEALAIAERIERLERELRAVLSGNVVIVTPELISAPSPVSKRGGKRKLSPATIAKMKASQQARWAEKNVTILDVLSPLDKPSKSTKGKAAKAPKKNGGITPEGRAKLAAAMKARWAAKKKAAK
jgi:hypothetical protein